MSRQGRLVWAFIAVTFAVFFAASWASTLYVDYLWFGNLRFTPVWLRSIAWEGLTGLAGGVFFSLFIYLNLRLAVRDGYYFPTHVIPFPYTRWFRPQVIRWVLLGVSLLFGMTAGLATAAEWLTAAGFVHRVAFGVADPVFGKDVGFFVFSLPFWTLLQQLCGGAVFLSLLMAGAVYALTGQITFTDRWPLIHPRARGHLFGLAAVLFFLKAAGYVLDMFKLVYSPRGVAFGASYTDIHVQLPGLQILAALSLLAGLVAAANIHTRSGRWLGAAIVALALASLLLGRILPSAVQKFVVEPNEINRETPYIKENIKYTRLAYGLDKVVEKEFPVAASLSAADIEKERGTVENIRLWNWDVLKESIPQLQAIRQYYHFKDTDIDRYNVGGRLRQVLLSAREIGYDALPEDTWINRHLKYTHGYGVVAAPASEVTREGLPVLWVKDIPPVAQAGAEVLAVKRPEIYFGELTDEYAIVGTSEDEFDYPQGDKNSYTRYQGQGGIPIGGYLQRLAFALYSGDYNVLFSGAIGRDSRVLMYRNIRDRVQRIAPFLLYDPDPYLVISRGKLYWIQDAYTVTGRYPYSERTRVAEASGFNYIRNSVKVVIDAYNGFTTFFLADENDPLAQTYQRIFPGLFQPLGSMDPDLRAHLRYPELLFEVQLDMYAVYHMQNAEVFYNKEDRWQRPLEQGDGREPRYRDAYYVIMQLPDAGQPEFLLISPFTPTTKKNMVAWMAARSDGAGYGQLVVYKFPKQKLVYGPEQVEALITQNDVVAEKKTLWSQQNIVWGSLLVIPVRDSLLYVQPLYLRSTSTKMPELRRVVVVYNNRVAMEDTLERALAAALGPAPQGPPIATATGEPGSKEGAGGPPDGAATGRLPDEMQALIREAGRLYDEAQAALKRGDWAGYGERINRLGTVLQRLQER